MLFRPAFAKFALGILLLFTLHGRDVAGQAGRGRGGDSPVVHEETISVGDSKLKIDFANGTIDLPEEQVIRRIQKAAVAVAAYYGRFPVFRVRILVVPVAGKHGVLQGTTWGDREGFPAVIRLRIGELTNADELADDWIITHELVHTALTSLPDDQNWLEEGLASYVEPIARVQAGELVPEFIWGEMMRGMKNGEPQFGDRGLNHTHTWGRTYWGGALFCLMVDVEIRRQTGNREGLQDALRAIVAAGGTIDTEWPPSKLLSLADRTTGVHVLETMYAQWSEVPVTVDLAALWEKLGVQSEANRVTFDSSAPWAAVRLAITDSYAPVVAH